MHVAMGVRHCCRMTSLLRCSALRLPAGTAEAQGAGGSAQAAGAHPSSEFLADMLRPFRRCRLAVIELMDEGTRRACCLHSACAGSVVPPGAHASSLCTTPLATLPSCTSSGAPEAHLRGHHPHGAQLDGSALLRHAGVTAQQGCALLCCALLCCAVPCRAVPCCAVPCCAMPCCAMPCRAVLCRAVLCRAMTSRAAVVVGGCCGSACW